MIESWRGLSIRDQLGWGNPQDHKDKLEGMKQSVSGEFLTKEARDKIDSGQVAPDDPYVRKWIDVSISSMFRSAEMDEKSKFTLFTIYDISSAWQHWSCKGLTQAINENDEYSENNLSEDIMSLGAGVLCLWDVANSANIYFKLNADSELSMFHKQIADCSV